MLITLKNEIISAGIDTVGAELKSWKDSLGKEYIWCGDPEFWGSSSPLLFPMIGNVRDGKTIINGEEYELPRHGVVRRDVFQVLEQSDVHVVFSTSYTEETLKVFPFRYNLRLTYKLEGEVLKLIYDVYNLDDKEMYFHIGAHPAFNCPMFEGEKFSDYVIKFEKEETTMSPPYDLVNKCIDNENRILRLDHSDTLHMEYEDFDNDALIFDDIKSRKISLINPAHGKGVEVDFNSFETVAFWTIRKDAPYLCVEPWNGAAIYSDEDNEFKNKRKIQTAKPQEKCTYQLKMRILS